MSLLHYLLLLNSKLWEQNHQLGCDERVNMLYNIILRNHSLTQSVYWGATAAMLQQKEEKVSSFTLYWKKKKKEETTVT